MYLSSIAETAMAAQLQESEWTDGKIAIVTGTQGLARNRVIVRQRVRATL